MATCIGCGLNSDAAGLLEVQLRPGGGIECDPDGADAGLFLTPTGPATISTTPGSCTGISGNGSPGSPLRVDADISEDACNGITCRANGLYAHCPDSLVCSINVPGTGGGAVPVALSAGTFDLLSNCTAPPSCATCVAACGTNAIQVCQNGANAICCQTSGFWEIIAYGGVISTNPGFEATVLLRECLDGSFGNSVPLTNKKFFNSTGGAQIWELGGFHAKNFIVSNLNDCHTFAAAIRIIVVAGTGSWIVAPEFEFYWHYTQTGCC